MRKSTAAERAWCARLCRLMRQMPPTMRLFADGELHAACAKLEAGVETPKYGLEFQPIAGIGSLGKCDGGDPWNG